MPVDLFAGLPVTDYERSLAWYERFLGSEPSFVPNAIEAVWELAEHRFVFIEERPQHAGHAMHTIFVDDLDVLASKIAAGGIELPSGRPTPTVFGRRPIEPRGAGRVGRSRFTNLPEAVLAVPARLEPRYCGWRRR